MEIEVQIVKYKDNHIKIYWKILEGDIIKKITNKL